MAEYKTMDKLFRKLMKDPTHDTAKVVDLMRINATGAFNAAALLSLPIVMLACATSSMLQVVISSLIMVPGYTIMIMKTHQGNTNRAQRILTGNVDGGVLTGPAGVLQTDALFGKVPLSDGADAKAEEVVREQLRFSARSVVEWQIHAGGDSMRLSNEELQVAMEKLLRGDVPDRLRGSTFVLPAFSKSFFPKQVKVISCAALAALVLAVVVSAPVNSFIFPAEFARSLAKPAFLAIVHNACNTLICLVAGLYLYRKKNLMAMDATFGEIRGKGMADALLANLGRKMDKDKIDFIQPVFA